MKSTNSTFVEKYSNVKILDPTTPSHPDKAGNRTRRRKHDPSGFYRLWLRIGKVGV